MTKYISFWNQTSCKVKLNGITNEFITISDLLGDENAESWAPGRLGVNTVSEWQKARSDLQAQMATFDKNFLLTEMKDMKKNHGPENLIVGFDKFLELKQKIELVGTMNETMKRKQAAS